MIPGDHYRFKRGGDNQRYTVSLDQANRNFFIQCLTGDTSDNIPGIRGVGVKTAEKILADSNTPMQMDNDVYDKWLEGFAYKTAIGIDVVIVVIFVVFVIAISTVSFHAVKAGNTNPVDSLRHE